MYTISAIDYGNEKIPMCDFLFQINIFGYHFIYQLFGNWRLAYGKTICHFSAQKNSVYQ
jgi:hypothetical protein